MKKLDLSKYTVEVATPDGLRTLPYDLKNSLRNILFHPEQRLSSIDLLDNNKLAEKILAAGEAILLEKDDYNRLKKAIDTFHGFGQNDVEMVSRVLNAPDVPVQESKS